ncbi:MAG TPA: hypothetical protein VMD02_05765 [Candidatus Omnitrophota bacterium]|nr:hypothetical protein [Candidatus Omnitrophota bacterium]
MALPFENDFIFQHFLSASITSLPAMQQIQEIVAGGNSLVSLGGPNGANLTGPEGVFSPPGWDRAYVENLGPFQALCAKGTGFSRAAEDAYQNETYGLARPGSAAAEGLATPSTQFVAFSNHLPFDINPRAQFFDHVIVGGNNYEDLMENATGAYEMLRLAFGLGRERGGIVMPLSITLLKEFPVPLRDRKGMPVLDKKGEQVWDNMSGWNYFTSSKVFADKDKLLKVGRFVNRWSNSKIIKWASERFITNIQSGKKVSTIIRWLVGRTFMKLHKPGVYTYLADSFRIGNAFRQLVTNGYRTIEKGLTEHGLVSKAEMHQAREKAKAYKSSPLKHIDNKILKIYMDRVVHAMFAPFGEVELPRINTHDLTTQEGRMAYLREVKDLNPEKSEMIAREITKEIASQLGMLHGTGGNGGGHSAMHMLGKITLTVEEPKTGQTVRIVMKMQEEGEKTYSMDIFADEEEKVPLPKNMDFTGWKVIAVESSKHGNYRMGQPGGGAARPDNLGYGLRDLHSIEVTPSSAICYAVYYPTNINGLPVGDIIYHHHAKIIQEAEMNLLFSPSLGEMIDGEEKPINGAIYQLNDVFGGGEKGAAQLVALFWEEYQKWYALSMSKYASKTYQATEALQPIYLIQHSFRRNQAYEQLKRRIYRFTDPEKQEAEDAIQAA